MGAVLVHVDVISPGLVLALVLVALGALFWFLRQVVRLCRRRAHAARASRWLPVTLSMVAVLVLVPTAAAATVNYHYEYLPNMAAVVGLKTWPSAPLPRVVAATASVALARPAAPFPQGVVTRLPITGVTSGFGTRNALVYLPPQYFSQPGRRFPVAYLLHGAPGAPIDWFRAGDAAQGGLAVARQNQPVILVAPKLSRSWLSDSECVNGRQGNVETYLSGDVPAAVDSAFRTDATRGSRLLVGLSAGGFCALNVGLKYRAEFGAIADFSGLDRPTYPGGPRALYGTADPARSEAADSPWRYIPVMSPMPLSRVYLSVGRSDHGPLAAARRIDPELIAAHQRVTLRVTGGSHDYAFWRAQLPVALSWWSGTN